MCTVSILRASGGRAGYDLWFNRDERLTRAPERPPVAGVTAGGTRYVAPMDGERGGTWLLLNERGLTVCVLNDYEATRATAGEVSRGCLPLIAAGCGEAREALGAARAWVEKIGAGKVGPFLFIAADETGRSDGLGWDGAVWTERGALEFASSSSFRPAEVRRIREDAHAALATVGRTEERVARLHWSHDPAAGAESVRMRRPDACTRSVSVARVRRGAERILRYAAVDWTASDGVGAQMEAGW